jgi:hypothetical protein
LTEEKQGDRSRRRKSIELMACIARLRKNAGRCPIVESVSAIRGRIRRGAKTERDVADGICSGDRSLTQEA